MAESRINLALAYSALTISSGLGIIKSSDLKYARAAFFCYLTNGVVGLIKNVYHEDNNIVDKSQELFSRLSRPIYTPLIAAEAILFAGFPEIFSLGHLVFPVGYLVITEVLKKDISSEYLGYSTIANSVSLCFSAYIAKDIFGGVCAIINFIAFMGTSHEVITNSTVYLSLIVAANILAVQFFNSWI